VTGWLAVRYNPTHQKLTTIAIIHTANETREYIYQQVPNGGSKKAGGDHADLLQGFTKRSLGSENQKIMKNERIPQHLNLRFTCPWAWEGGRREKEGIGIHKLGKNSKRNRRNV
jgi:hypothetical protein